MSFFSLRRTPQGHGSLGWDLHAHLLPGVDDGVKSVDESLEAIARLHAIGYSGCVVTPHIYKDVHDNNAAELVAVFGGLQAALASSGIPFGLTLAAEYFADQQLIELAQQGQLISFSAGGVPCVLVEFPYISEPLLWADALSAVARAGYQPVIAHPERYRYFNSDPDLWLERFGPFPVRYQCEIGSLSGQYGQRSYSVARLLLKRGIPTFWGTDLHRTAHIDRFIVPGLKRLGCRGVVNPTLINKSPVEG